ncbi:response regulator [Pedosphaera parvula]|uniref:Response regulator receiver protein n=1 Tax=Pedosphaera parvula (strain Ellin514) TaxID=320771 RepID=B9XQQ6_PEDPL|nr:response regulator [Pedosphaera parvula]EEF57838.1 response regulator receiver protein [Pedosphaera parvula Ellin514]
MDRNLTILIAEDNPDDVMLFKRALLKAGINNPVQVVQSGREAIEYLQGSGKFADRNEHPFPSVLFTDLSMPSMNGFELLRWLRAHPVCFVFPVVVLTSSEMDIDVKQAYQLGANSYMVKPNSFNDLVQMVRATYEYWSWCEKTGCAGELLKDTDAATDVARS